MLSSGNVRGTRGGTFGHQGAPWFQGPWPGHVKWSVYCPAMVYGRRYFLKQGLARGCAAALSEGLAEEHSGAPGSIRIQWPRSGHVTYIVH